MAHHPHPESRAGSPNNKAAFVGLMASLAEVQRQYLTRDFSGRVVLTLDVTSGEVRDIRISTPYVVKHGT